MNNTPENYDISDDDNYIHAFPSNAPLLDTSALVLDFKPISYGDTVTTLARSLFSGDILNSIATTTSRNAARHVAFIRRRLFSTEDIALDKCPSLDKCFDEEGHLMEDYVVGKSPEMVNALELNYAFLKAITACAHDVNAAWDRFFANAPRRLEMRPQYGLSRNSEGKFERISVFEEAVAYYYDQVREVVDAKAEYERVKNRENVPARKVLNF
jgi:hypothetical protein